jgi:AraC-like DNA-binding protein
MLTYREHPVPPPLRGVVATRWTLDAGAAPVPGWLVLPDAHTDLVAVAGQPVVLAGPATGAAVVDVPAGASVAGLRLLPGATQALFGVPAAVVRDASPPIADVWRPAAHTAADEPDDAPDARIAALARVLASAARDAAAPDALVRHAAAAVRDPARRVADVAREVALSERQLRRRFDVAVGLGAKRLQRIVRLQRGLAVHAREPVGSLARLAADLGYADQAHLTREWVDLTGLTPRTLLDRRQAQVATEIG